MGSRRPPHDRMRHPAKTTDLARPSWSYPSEVLLLSSRAKRGIQARRMPRFETQEAVPFVPVPIRSCPCLIVEAYAAIRTQPPKEDATRLAIRTRRARRDALTNLETDTN